MKTLLKSLLAVCIALTANGVYSVESQGYITQSGIQIIPLFDTKLEYVDNIGRLSDAENPESSSVLIVDPGIALSSDRNGNQYQIAYQISSGTYFGSSEDNFLDHRLTTNNFIQLNRRHGLGLNYSYLALHEERGTGILAGDTLSKIADGPAKYGLHNVSATYVFGSEGAKGRVESNIRYERKKYKNYRNLVIDGSNQLSTAYKDYDEVGGGIAIYFRTFPSTQLLAEYDVASRGFDLNDPETNQSQDSLNSFYYLGAKWEITGKTEGKLRLGLQDKSYEDRTRKDFDGFSWDLDVNWQPLNYSTVTLSAAQRAVEPSQGTNYIDQTSFDGSWKHFWLTNFYSNVAINLTNDDYSETSRTDDLAVSSLSFGYELIDYAAISLGWSHEENDSSIKTNSYKQDVWYLAMSLVF